MYAAPALASQLLAAHERTLFYEDPETQKAALNAIPVQRLREEAGMSGGRSEAPTGAIEKRPAPADRLLYALLCWFKDEFFSWFDAPTCARCSAQMALVGRRQVSPVQPLELAQHAERFSCPRCGTAEEFPRYNHPRKLLETRRGRCGEWANCFALCCRALGFETRFVEDQQDHVWTEVYSDAERRWLHCDPCERALDQPHIYEAGWGKKHQYVLAAACDEVADVTFRYSVDFAATAARRRSYSEAAVAETLGAVNRRLQRGLAERRRQQLAERRVRELVLLLRPPPTVCEAPGRQSGSLVWRLARGETRPISRGFVFRPTEEERAQRRLQWSYSAVEDRYRRGAQWAAGWASCVYSAEAVQRKVERDWHQAYLCRTEGAAAGSVSWRVDLNGTGLTTEKVRVRHPAAEFGSGRARWSLNGDGLTVPLTGDGSVEGSSVTDTVTLEAETVTVTAWLDGGDGANAFQQSQLCRAPLDGPDSPLEVTVWLKEEV
ncbi:Peptide-N(4)-(N-acetyl-beta-glucosaminyl)asparagine amidase [Amphibalanus amphitrite]|uniref:Peptide-N(4)-(N-acetyl-beta-glucosaminyl)asparagine amidase n=1 Tax=Amphibalanus amphitrite TaxID=1232801 RepID=A0A6A4X8V4_AMPAM|nr:Peptide-N(4)-(N-acetyl-beta-glucosaminyl)asparagine amidase [Amphibalanus amphitrite]